MSVEDTQKALDTIAGQIAVCTLCQLHQGRTRAVPGAGPADAEILFIGEGPGYHEDKQGLPFVGNSGKFLEEMLGKIGLNRNQVFITNVVKCRPPENRDPLPVEVETCTKAYLFKQIDLISPKVIVTLGRFSMGLFFPGAKITQIHGQPKWDNGRALLPLFHPAAVLRNISMKPQAEADFKKIPELLAEWKKRNQSTPPPAEEDKSETPQEPPTQLSLF
jgi:uracil-DNA glycosylase